MEKPVKVAVFMPDELRRRAKAVAALEGESLTALIKRLLRGHVEASEHALSKLVEG